MQADEEVNEQPNQLNNDDEVSDAEEEDSPLLQSCRGIIDDLNFGQVEYLCKLVGVQFWYDCNEEDFERSKLPCIRYLLAERFSSKGDGGDDILRSVLNNDDDDDVIKLLYDAELLDLYEYSEYIQSLQNSKDDVEDNNSSSKKDEGVGGIGDSSLFFEPINNWSDDLSAHDGDGESVESNVEVGVSVHPPKAVVPTRIKSPNDVTDTREFSAQEEPTNSQLAESAGCRYIEQDEAVPPPVPPPRLVKIDPVLLFQHYEDEYGALCITLPALKQSGNKRMHPSAKEIVKEYSSRAFNIVKQHGCYLDTNSPTFDQHTFPLHYEKNGLKNSAAVYGVWKLIDASWVLDKIGCALKLLGRIAIYPDTEYRVRVLVDVDGIPYQVQELLKQNTMEMIAELACPSNGVYEPLRLFYEKLPHTAGIDAGIGRSITVQTIENGVGYDVKSYEQGSRVKIIAELACWDSELQETMCDQVITAAFSLSQLPELQPFYEGKEVLARALVNWASGKREDQESSHIKHTEYVGIHPANIRDALQARFAGASKVGAGATGDALRHNSDYSPEELKVGAEEYSIELKDCIRLALEGKLVYCLLNYWPKYFTWLEMIHMITTVHTEVDATSSLDVGFTMIAHVFNNPAINVTKRLKVLPSELVYFVLNLPAGGSVLACVNKSFSSAADATYKTDDRTALRTALAQQFVATTLSEMRGEGVTGMKCIQAVHDKLKVQNDFHLTKMISAAFSRFSISGVDSFLSSRLQRSEVWTDLARRQARGRSCSSMSSLNENGKRSIQGAGKNISWLGMIAFTNSATIPECLGNLAIYCAESTNPVLCWKRVLADLYGCDWYPILSRIAELAYNIRLPSDEVQQARLNQRQDTYATNLSIERGKREKKKVYVLPEVPQDPIAFQNWLKKRKALWREMRRKRRISAEPNVSTGLSSLPFQVWLQNRKTSWRETRNKRDKATATKKRKSVEEDEVVATSDRLAKRHKKISNEDSLASASSPWNEMTVAELKTHLKDRNLPVSGLKSVLVQRLEECNTIDTTVSTSAAEQVRDKNAVPIASSSEKKSSASCTLEEPTNKSKMPKKQAKPTKSGSGGSKNSTEKQTKEKHLMEMWSMTRREISELRKDLKNEEDAYAIADMEQDLRQLRKRKAEYANQLGMNEE